jgi:paraquat-inducible protein A
MIPANLLPIMKITSMGKIKYSTIYSGIVDFANEGSYGIAAIIFTASIFVPIFKISVLLYMLILTKIKSKKHAIIGVKLYKIIHLIGKWSMLDIFVVGIMISLVQYDFFISISAGGALFAFSLVVLLTILATQSMDPRLMFDHLEDKEDY